MRPAIIAISASLAMLAGGLLFPRPAGAQPPKVKVQDSQHKEKTYDLGDAKHKEEFLEKLYAGQFEQLALDKPQESPISIRVDLGIWTVVVFLLLAFILHKVAWGPMLEGLHKREQTIKDAVEEAKKARRETEKVRADFKAQMDKAYAEIPKIMEEARRDAEALKEELRTQANKEIQADRQRLRREIDTARDQALQEIWNQSAHLATVISGKVLARIMGPDDHNRLLDLALEELQTSGQRYREEFLKS